MRWNVLLAALFAVGAAALLVTTEAPIEDPVWWYTNTTPPDLALAGPPGPLRGPAQASVSLAPRDRAHLVAVTLDGQPLATPPDGAPLALNSANLPDGPHLVQVTARDTSRNQNTATATWRFVSDNAPPRLDVRLDPVEGPVEGRTWEIKVRSSKPDARLEGTVLGHPLRLTGDGAGGYWALEGITPGLDASQVDVHLDAQDPLGNAASFDQSWPIRHTHFPEDDLTLDPGQVQPEARAQENARLNALYAQQDGPRRWSGPFVVPVDGPVTTDFGTHRSYEYHPGTDFAAPLGAPVRAPAPGTVVFAGAVPARGNVLVLDHGDGVYTTYAHLQKFEAAAGTDVEAGDLVARVGTTGFSTGPHLHWELWVNSSNVDPMEWTSHPFP